MNRFLNRTLLATLCMLLLVLPATAAETPIDNNELEVASTNNSPSGLDQTGGPQAIFEQEIDPSNVNYWTEGSIGISGIAEERMMPDQNYDQAMDTDFDQGVISCECSGAFEVGDRVTALVDNPSGATGILAGHQGWVICGSGSNPDILVSWDGWLSGHFGAGCACPVTSLPQTSGWFVLCSEISVLPSEPVTCICPGTYSTGDRVRATVDSPQGASGILAGDTGTVVCGISTGFPNLLISWDNWQSGHTGSSCNCPSRALPDTSGWFVDCPDVELLDVDCACFPGLKSGDRVTATVSDPQGASGVTYGRGGTVVCGYSVSGGLPILISWDDWQIGHNGNGFCECPVTSLPDNSGWWLECTEITPSVSANCGCVADDYSTGDRVEAVVNNPAGQPDVFLGDTGTVICAKAGGLEVFISWDGVTSGHDGNGLCECPVVALDNTSGWWVNCSDIVPAGTGPVNTLDVALDAVPDNGSVPFTTTFTAQMTNLTTENRRAASRVDVVIANGTAFSNWKSGWTNLSSLENFSTSWNTNIPSLGSVIGNNVFTMNGEDVTPAPFNQAPYAPSGDTDVDATTVVAN